MGLQLWRSVVVRGSRLDRSQDGYQQRGGRARSWVAVGR